MVIVTFSMIGLTPSITRSLLAPREFAAPGLGRTNKDVLPATSLIAPPITAKADELM